MKLQIFDYSNEEPKLIMTKKYDKFFEVIRTLEDFKGYDKIRFIIDTNVEELDDKKKKEISKFTEKKEKSYVVFI